MNFDEFPNKFNDTGFRDIIINLLNLEDGSVEELIEETIKITEIPAPPFQEELRAEYLFNRFKKKRYFVIKKRNIEEIP